MGARYRINGLGVVKWHTLPQDDAELSRGIDDDHEGGAGIALWFG
jgi:hypothetical protein